MGPDAFVSWMLNFKPASSVFSFTLLTRLFSSSLLSARWYHLHIRGYWYFSWQSWFQLVIHPAWHFSWCTLHKKLNKQGDNIQPWCTPLPIWNQSVVPCLVLTVASWLAYRFLRRQVRWSGIPLFKNFIVKLKNKINIKNKKKQVKLKKKEFSTVCCDPHSQRPWCSQ